MKFAVVLASLFVGVALSNSLAYYGWQPQRELVYRYQSQVLSGIPSLKSQYAGLKLASDVIVQTFRDYSLRIKFMNPKYIVVNDELRVQDGRPQMPKPTQEVPEEIRRFLTEPFEVHLKRGVVESLGVNRDEPVVVTNIKKSLLSQIQIDISASRRGEIPSSLPNEILTQLRQDEDQGESILEKKTYFATEETTLIGDCLTEYNVHLLPRYQATEIESKIKVSEQKLEQIGAILGEKSQGEELCKGKKYFEITKTKNLDNCKQRPIYQSTSGIKPKCDFSKSHCDDLLTQISTTRYIVCGNSLEDFIIREVETNNEIVTNPIGFEVTEEKTVTSARVNLMLIKMKEGSWQPLPKPHDETRKTSLVFEYPIGKPLSNKGSKGITPGAPLPLDDFVSVLPKPDLRSGSAIWPSHIPFPEVKQKIVREISEVAMDFFSGPESCPSKKDVAGRLSAISYYMRPLSLHEIREIEAEISSSSSVTDDKKKLVKELFLDILAMTGSNPTVMIIKEKIQRRELNKLQSVKLLQDVLRNVKTPTIELLKELMDLIKSLRSDRILFNMGLTQLSTLVQTACIDPTLRLTMYPVRIFGKFCSEKSEFITEEYIPWIQKELMETRKESEKLVLISALGKIGHPKVLSVLSKVIEGKVSKSPLARSLAVYSLKSLAKIEPSMVRPILAKIIDNPAENTEVRIAAISVLPWTKPSTAELQKIAVRSWFEPSKQVASFIYSTLKNLEETVVPELRQVGLQAKNVKNIVKPFQYGVQFSHNSHTQALVKYLRIAHSLETSYVNTAKTITPAKMSFSSHMFGGSWEIDGLTFNIYTKGMDTFIDDALVKMGYRTSASSEVRQELGKISQKLNIQERNKETPEMFIQLGMMGMERVYSLDEEIYNEIIQKVSEQIRNNDQQFRNEPRNIHLNMTYSQYSLDIESVGPCEAGFPILVKRNIPTVIGIQGVLRTGSERGMLSGLKASIVPVVNSKLQANMGLLSPFSKEFIGSGVEQSIHSSVPFNVKAEMGSSKSELLLTFSTNEEAVQSKKLEVAHFYVRPYTVTKSLQDIIPISKSHKVKTIETGVPMKKWSLPVAKWLGLESELSFESDNHKIDFSYLWNLYSENSLFSLLSYGSTIPSVKYTSLKLEFDPLSSKTKEVKSRWMLVHGKKAETTEEIQMSFPRPEEVDSTVQEEQIQNMCRNRHQSYSDISKCVEIEKDMLESRLETHQNARQMLQELRPGSSAFGVRVETSLHSQRDTERHSSRNAVKTQFLIGHEVEGSLVNCYADLLLKTPFGENYYIKARSSTEKPQIPFRWNIHSLLDNEIKLKNNIAIKYGQDGKFDKQVKLELELLKSEELKEELKRSPEMRRCESEVSNDRELASVCDETRHLAVSVDKIVGKLEVPSSWKKSPLVQRLLAAGEYLILPSVTIHPKSESSQLEDEEGQMTLKAEVKFNLSRNFLQAFLETSRRSYEIRNVPVSKSLQFFPMSLRNNISQRILQDITRDQAPASCRLDNKFISTFDNVTYNYEMSDCEHLLFKDCSDYKLVRPIAVLAKKEGAHGTTKKSVRIISGHYIVELKPTTSRVFGGSVAVFVNGKEEHISPMDTLVKKNPETGSVELRVHKFKDGVVSVSNPLEGLEVFFDSKKIEIVAPQLMRNRACGLCGDLNLENTVDLKTPEQCIMTKPKFSGYSYMIKEGNCDYRIPEEDRQWYEKERRECVKSDFIPTPVEQLAKVLKKIKSINTSKSLINIVEKRANEVCISKKKIRTCGGLGEVPVGVKHEPVSFVCLPKSNLDHVSLQNKAEAGEDVTPYLLNMPVQYSKNLPVAQKCIKRQQENLEMSLRGQQQHNEFEMSLDEDYDQRQQRHQNQRHHQQRQHHQSEMSIDQDYDERQQRQQYRRQHQQTSSQSLNQDYDTLERRQQRQRNQRPRSQQQRQSRLDQEYVQDYDYYNYNQQKERPQAQSLDSFYYNQY